MSKATKKLKPIIEKSILATKPWSCTLSGKHSEIDVYVEATGNWEAHFLDPILTNRIFCPENYEPLADYMRQRNQTTNRPWNDRQHEETLIKEIIESDALFEQLPTRTYNTDFELTCSTIAIDDDWIHILVYEGVNLEPKEYLPIITERTGLPAEQISETIALRSFREWTRKLYYKLEHTDIFNKIFGNENFTYMLDQSIQALGRVSADEGDRSFMHLKKLFKECKTHADFYLVRDAGGINRGQDHFIPPAPRHAYDCGLGQ